MHCHVSVTLGNVLAHVNLLLTFIGAVATAEARENAALVTLVTTEVARILVSLATLVADKQATPRVVWDQGIIGNSHRHLHVHGLWKRIAMWVINYFQADSSLFWIKMGWLGVPLLMCEFFCRWCFIANRVDSQIYHWMAPIHSLKPFIFYLPATQFAKQIIVGSMSEFSGHVDLLRTGPAIFLRIPSVLVADTFEY